MTGYEDYPDTCERGHKVIDRLAMSCPYCEAYFAPCGCPLGEPHRCLPDTRDDG